MGETEEVVREYGCEYGCLERFTRLELLQHLLNCPRHEIESKQTAEAVENLIWVEMMKGEKDAESTDTQQPTEPST